MHVAALVVSFAAFVRGEEGGPAPCHEGGTFCAPCEGGFYFDEETNQCLECSPGYFSSAGSQECTPCAPGTVSLVAGSPSCSLCDAGFEAAQTHCEPCQPGHYSPMAGTSCQPCKRGTFAADSMAISCETCSEGSIAQVGAWECEACAPGHYETKERTACVRCEPNAVSPGHRSWCDECQGGSVPNEHSSECVACGSGEFAPFGATKCAPCPPNRISVTEFESSTGAEECSKCSSGSEANAEKDMCIACAPGYFSPYDGSSCRACPPGRVSSEGASSCEACAPGEVAGSAGLSNCTKCGAGMYATRSTITESAAGGTEGTGNTLCKKCPFGTVAEEGSNACTVCPEHNMRPKADQSECDHCAPGSVSKQGDSGCTRCGPNRYRYASFPWDVAYPGPDGPPPSVHDYYAWLSLFNGGEYSGSGDGVGSGDGGDFRRRLYSLPGDLSFLHREQSHGRVLNPEGWLFQHCTDVYVQCGSVPGCPEAFENFLELAATASNENSIPAVMQLLDCILAHTDYPESFPPECDVCPAGYQVHEDERIFCSPCEPGSFSPRPGAACRPCERGSANSEHGKPMCNVCEAGSIAPSMGQWECDPCHMGTISNEERTKCIPCGDGAAAMCNTDGEWGAGGV